MTYLDTSTLAHLLAEVRRPSMCSGNGIHRDEPSPLEQLQTSLRFERLVDHGRALTNLPRLASLIDAVLIEVLEKRLGALRQESFAASKLRTQA